MSVRRDKLGRWTVDILFRDADGIERRVTRASAKWTKRDGRAWERDSRRHLADGTCDQWREEVQAPELTKLHVVPLNVVQAWLGHSTITITITIAMTMKYAHLAPDGGAEWIRALEQPQRQPDGNLAQSGS